MTDPSQRKRRWLIVGTGIGAVLVSLGVVSDIGEEDATLLELVLDGIETLLMVTGACGVGLLLDQVRADHSERLELMHNLAVARHEGEQWRTRVQSQVAGIGVEIGRQFDEWGLTSAESEVGRLMLKGMSHKEIASLRGTSESTGRQQARSVYQKSRLPNKAAFCAYFLEDLLPPSTVAPPGIEDGNRTTAPQPALAVPRPGNGLGATANSLSNARATTTTAAPI